MLANVAHRPVQASVQPRFGWSYHDTIDVTLSREYLRQVRDALKRNHGKLELKEGDDQFSRTGVTQLGNPFDQLLRRVRVHAEMKVGEHVDKFDVTFARDGEPIEVVHTVEEDHQQVAQARLVPGKDDPKKLYAVVHMAHGVMDDAMKNLPKPEASAVQRLLKELVSTVFR